MQVIISTWSSFSEKWCLSHIHVNILNFQNLTPDITRLRFLNLIINLCKFNLNLIITSVTLLISNFNLCVPLSPFTRELFYIPEKKPFVYEKKNRIFSSFNCANLSFLKLMCIPFSRKLFPISKKGKHLFIKKIIIIKKKQNIFFIKRCQCFSRCFTNLMSHKFTFIQIVG